MRVSQKAFDLIVSEEVTSKSHYEAKLRHTEWPGASSGVTVGIGYDLGQTDREKIREDWRGRVSESMLSSMLSASGVCGSAANSLANSLKASIDIPWDVAIAVHRECVLPRWEAVVQKALPNTEKLSPDCFGALVSLTFNRGASFDKEGDRYREMRAIKAHMAAGAFDRIPAEIRSMKRIWQDKGVDGLLRRRDAEADMFQHGLSAPVATSRPTVSELANRARAGEGIMATGAGLLRRAREHIGEKYVNSHVPKDDPNWKGPWDCAEFISWLVYQEASILYGCLDDNAKPSEADAYTGAWQTDVKRLGIRVSVDEAAATVGGIVLRYPPGPGKMGHIALCDGKGGTVEAKGRKYGVVADTVHDRGWHTGVLIPGISYESAHDTMPVRAPTVLYAINAPNMDRAIVVEIQKALASKGFSPGGIDGEYGNATALAVAHFQESQGLVADGEVGRDTADALGVSLTGAKPVEGAKPAEPPVKPIEPPVKPAEPTTRPFEPIVPGVEAMNPLIILAARVLPGIIQTIAGDKAGTVANAVTKAVTDITRTQNPKEAEDKLNADPAVAMALQLKLAEIANAQEEARQKAQLALLKEQNEQEIKRQQAQLEALKQQSEADAKKREADFQALQAKLDDTKDARASLRGLAAMPGADKWVLRSPPVLSYIITMGFFLVLGFLLLFGIAPWAQNGKSAEQVVYIVIGALTAALATVVNFWLGSSQSSQRKDVANERQTAQNAELIERSAKQNAEILEQSAKRNADLLKTVMKSTPAAKVEKPAKQLERCLDIVLKQEAILERSGVTKFGITLEELQSSRNDQSLADKNLMELSRDDAYEFYRMRYWNVLKCDELPIGVDLVVFDTAADIGLAKSAKLLQDVVGAKDDGSMGPVTMGAVKLMTPLDIVTKLSELRRENKRGSSEGMSRIKEIEDAARQMIAAASAVAV